MAGAITALLRSERYSYRGRSVESPFPWAISWSRMSIRSERQDDDETTR
jgi:hypothetical protein